MTLIQTLRRIRAVLDQDRDALFYSHVSPASGKVEDAQARAAIQELDSLIAWIDNFLNHAESEASHV